MPFRSYDTLRAFVRIARHASLASAARELNLTKGAISHQVRQLEQDLGFTVFARTSRGIALTTKGQELLLVAQSAFSEMEGKIAELQQNQNRTLTIGVSTYFASRWLSSRLMEFMRQHPEIRIRIQPMIDLVDWRGEGIDMAIRWGAGKWRDVIIEPLFICPAWPTGNAAAFDRVQDEGLSGAFETFTLLRDRDDSDAWSDWYERSGLSYQARADTLIIPDPNVRVQAVIDGQGIALNDALVESEIESGSLFRLSSIALEDYGYHLAYPTEALSNADVVLFMDWMKGIADGFSDAFTGLS